MDELEGMSREDLLQIARDAKGQKAPITFDPNHPPAVQYVYREFPKMMYHRDGSYKVVDSKAEQEALGLDYFTSPNIPAHDPPAEEPAALAPKGKKKL